MTLIDRKIERYIARVCENLPLKYRNRAARELDELIRDTIHEYRAGETDILDVRKVLSELGKPEDLAMSWLAEAEEEQRRGRAGKGKKLGILELLALDFLKPETISRIAYFMMSFFTVLAVVLVVFGLLALGTHAINTMLPIFMGCLLALAASAGRTALQRTWLH